MREAVGNVFIVNFIITFVGIFIFFFAGSTAYTKAFKVKNKIINIIEEYETYNNSDVKAKINDYLSEAGYRVITSYTCPMRDGSKVVNGANGNSNVINDYQYCIYEFTDNDSENDYKYYGVQTYMYFDFPIIGKTIAIPVYGETKVLGRFTIE